jgi:hypothetical protein
MRQRRGSRPLHERLPALGRRRFLGLAAGLPVGLTGWLGQGCSAGGGATPVPTAGGGTTPAARTADGTAIPVPKVNGGINVHPLRRLDSDPAEQDPIIVPDLVALQVRAVYELGFDGLRITAPFGDRSSFLAAIPYVRAARALGIDAVIVLADFAGFVLAQALHDDDRRGEVLKLYATVFAPPPEPVRPGMGGLGPKGAGRVAFEILNEPTHFLGVPPEIYVHEFLAPCFTWLKASNPEVIVVSAAEVGNLDGPARVRAMLEAGLESVADRIAYHIYSHGAIALLSANVKQIVWITESGTAGTALHLPWVRDTFPEIKNQIGDVTRIFYYDLYDPEPGVYRLLDIRAEGGGYKAVVESSDLYSFFADNVAAEAAGRPLLGFDTLVPDIRAYFPTEDDLRAYDEVRNP